MLKVQVLPLSLVLASSALADWEPVFVDNFNGSAISPGHWVLGQENLPRQLQRYDSSAVQVSGGMLRLSTKNNQDGTRPYLSGAVTSQGLFAQQYGYYEVRARLPYGNGFWPAFWLMPVSGHWTSEIDIFEYIGHNNTLHHAMHYDWRSQNQNGKTIQPGVHLGKQFNTYALHWTPDRIRYLLNGQVRHEISRRHIVGKAKDPMYVMLNTAIASQHTGWIKGADSSTNIEQTFEIDYVRVYREVAKGRYKSIPSHTQAVADVVPASYDDVAVSIDVLDNAASTPAIIRKAQPLRASLKLTAHKPMNAAFWVSLHKATRFHKDGRIDARKLKVLAPKMRFDKAGQTKTLDIDFSQIGPLSPGFYYIDVVVRDNKRKHSNRSAARILSYQYPDRKQAVYWDAFIREASVLATGNALRISTRLQLQEAMLSEHLLLHYRVYDKASGRTLAQKQLPYTHQSIGLLDIRHVLQDDKFVGKDIGVSIVASDAANKNRSAEFDTSLSKISPPETVELKFDESR